ncbi:hypothetical protein [Streptomyces sp. SM12]|nr:hypothetical protein [Streptomyces sp. SM12]
MALRKTMKITPRPADAPPKDGDVVWDSQRGGWFRPAASAGKSGGAR